SWSLRAFTGFLRETQRITRLSRCCVMRSRKNVPSKSVARLLKAMCLRKSKSKNCNDWDDASEPLIIALTPQGGRNRCSVELSSLTLLFGETGLAHERHVPLSLGKSS